jgi:FtsP/CotA-like multicopper oxidase with cupredoxin domain
MSTRRQLIERGLVAGVGAAGLMRPGIAEALAAAGREPLDAGTIPQFVTTLPELEVIEAGRGPIELRMREFRTQVLPAEMPRTWVWGYLRPGQEGRSSYLGPVIVAERGTPTEVRWVNDLGRTRSTHLRAWVAATDQTVHWADPLHGEANTCAEAVEVGTPATGMCARHYHGPIPATAHLHGGEVPPVIDGGPDSWYTSDGRFTGHGYYSRHGSAHADHAVYRYPNVQEAAPIWFHDHTLGLTRLNVYAGLAGAYLITDPANPPPTNLPPPTPLAIQDRMFDTDGQLVFPAGVPFIPNPEHPYWVPEFIGDTILVDGKVWPFLEVEPKRYRFLILNGSNARGYEMFLQHRHSHRRGPAIWQIGTDGGYLDTPVKIDPNAGDRELRHLLMLPGERADVIVDFAGLAPGSRLVLRNVASVPWPGGDPPDPETTGRVMEFRVTRQTSRDTSYDPARGAPLRRPMVRLVDPRSGTVARGVRVQKTRQLTLNEVLGDPTSIGGVDYPGGPLEVLVNNTDLPGTDRPDFTPITLRGITTYYSELPREGETEAWEIVNLTADAHPMHLHLVQFQLMNRQRFDVDMYGEAYAAAFAGGAYRPGVGPPLDYRHGNPRALGGNPDIAPFLVGAARPPAPNEAGWKDTIISPPAEVTRIVVRWAPTDLPATTHPRDAFYPFDPGGKHGYVWHCHIIDHEDNEMMRPTHVTRNPAAVRTYVEGRDY